VGTQRAILNFTPGPRGWKFPLGVKLAPGMKFSPRGELGPQEFTPLLTPRSEHSIV
jgi:hypothetical protein